jgi:RNA polymerase sigma-70 factor (ECF subfamily)
VGWRVLANRWRKLRRRRTAYERYGEPLSVAPLNEDAVVLVTALRSLPAHQRVALVLFYILELSVAEIAEQTGVPVNTVKVRLLRGRRALAARLGTNETEANLV